MHVKKNNSRLDKYATLYIKNYRNVTKARIEISQEMNLDSKITYYWLGGVNDNNSIKYTKALPGTNDLFLEVRENTNTRFYNAKKTSMTGPDKDMCGTYTATNLAHWFLAQNQDNIERYKALNKIDDPTFALNGYDYSADVANISSIAQYFKNNRHMVAYAHIALEWLLAGRELPEYKNGPGWFTPILKDKSERYISFEPTASKDDLERIIFNAYEKNAVLSMDYYYTYQSKRILHAVNIWGFGVDEENNIVEIFQADSNVQNNALTNIGIYYKQNDSQPYLYNLAVKKGYGKTDWNIMDMTTLYNGRDLFEEYFATVK